VILDGEIVALDDDGVPCFSRLQRHWPQRSDQSFLLFQARWAFPMSSVITS
jgi:ATP-dependent DNA ligase